MSASTSKLKTRKVQGSSFFPPIQHLCLKRNTLPCIGGVDLRKAFETICYEMHMARKMFLNKVEYNVPHKHIYKVYVFSFTLRTNTVGHFMESKWPTVFLLEDDTHAYILTEG